MDAIGLPYLPARTGLDWRAPARLFERLTAPGAVRIILALAVFASHISNYEIGRPAVFVFFTLSGYWSSRVFEQRRGSAERFELGRFLRIWPQFALVAIAALLIMPALGAPANGTLASTLPLIGLASRTDDLLGVSWSLDIEMQFYLLLPLIFAAMAGIGGRRLPWIILIAAVTAAGSWWLSQHILTVFAFAPSFAVGVAIWRTRWSPSGRAALLSVAAFVIVAAVMAAVPEWRTLLLKDESQWWRDCIHMVWCLLLTPFIAWNVNRPSDGVDRHLGNLSYSFYLVHPLSIRIAAVLGSAAWLRLPGMGWKLLALGLSVAAALALYAAVDRPVETLRKRLTG